MRLPGLAHTRHPAISDYRVTPIAAWRSGLTTLRALHRSPDALDQLVACSIIVPMSTSPTQVVLADDDVLLREGLAGLLERSSFEVIGQCGDATELLSLVRLRRPDLAIVDIRMPPTHTSEGLHA